MPPPLIYGQVTIYGDVICIAIAIVERLVIIEPLDARYNPYGHLAGWEVGR